MVHLIGGPLHGMVRHDVDIEGALLGARIPIQNPALERRFVTVTETLPIPTDTDYLDYEVRGFCGTFYLCWPDFTPEEEQPGLLERHLNNPGYHTAPRREITMEMAEEAGLALEDWIRDENRQVFIEPDTPPTMTEWVAANQTDEGGEFTEEQFFRTMELIRNDTGRTPNLENRYTARRPTPVYDRIEQVGRDMHAIITGAGT